MQPEPTRLRRWIALSAIALLIVLAMLLVYTVLHPSDQPAQRLAINTAAFATLATALVSVILGYTASVHFDPDRHQRRHTDDRYRPAVPDESVRATRPAPRDALAPLQADRRHGSATDRRSPLARRLGVRSPRDD